MAQLNISRRQFGALAASAALASPLGVLAQGTYPNRPIRLVVGLAAGGSLDGQARSVARRLTEIAGVQVIVDNKPGASMMLSASEVMRAPADGYTLLYAPSSVFAQNPHTMSSVPYDPFKDFTPISLGGRGPLVLMISSEVPANNVRELVTYMKANAGKVNAIMTLNLRPQNRLAWGFGPRMARSQLYGGMIWGV